MRRSMIRTRSISRYRRHRGSECGAGESSAGVPPAPSTAFAPTRDFAPRSRTPPRLPCGAGTPGLLFRESLDMEFLHPLYIRELSVGQRVGDFASAICLGDAADGILNCIASLESEDTFDLVRIDVVGAVIIRRSVFQLDG